MSILQFSSNSGEFKELTDIQQITLDEAIQILETHEPKGLFVHKSEGWYIGIDNSTGESWSEEFITLDLCVKWLEREIEISDLEGEGRIKCQGIWRKA